MISNKIINKLAKLVACNQAYLVLDAKDLFYLTGFKDSGAVLFVGRKKLFFVLPEMLKAQFARSFPGAVVLDCKKLSESITALKSYGINEILLNASKVPYSLVEKLKKLKFKCKFYETGGLIADFRSVKSEFEIQNIKKACAITKKTFNFVKNAIRPGMSELDTVRLIKLKLLDFGADGIAFEPIAAIDSNSSMPHHSAGLTTAGANSLILLDFGCTYRGYNSDLTRVVFLGKIPQLHIKISKIVYKAYKQALNIVRPGESFAAVDKKAREVIDSHGYGEYFIHSLGHGVGLDIHEYPSISKQSKGFLKAGMVVTIEPGIYLPGLFGVRYENTVLVLKNGYKVLT